MNVIDRIVCALGALGCAMWTYNTLVEKIAMHHGDFMSVSWLIIYIAVIFRLLWLMVTIR